MRRGIKLEIGERARRSVAATLGLLSLFLVGCGGANGRGPTETEIRAAFNQKREADLAEMARSKTAFPPEGLSIASVDSDNCRDDGGGEFHCPAQLAELKNGRRLSEDHVLVMERTETGWRLRFVE